MIILHCGWEVNEETGQKEYIVFHGIDSYTLKHVCLPPQSPEKFPGVYYDDAMGEWCLPEAKTDRP